jgi:D-alanyl-D-alanine carboxypeptidase (penicillin-binding protein 5/6)
MRFNPSTSAPWRLRALVLMSIWLAALGLSPHGASAQVFQTLAPQAILYDTATRSVLFERGADDTIPPASMVKMMTALLVFEELRQGRLTLEAEMLVSENAWRRGGAASGGSAMFALPNSRIKVSDLLSGLLTQSGNDAAIALAEGIAGSEANFVTLMNEKGAKIGLRRTTFRNSTGFSHPEQRSTARELMLLGEHVISTYPEYYRFFSLREFTWNRVRQVNRNPLLTMDIGADGVKTGQIEETFGLVGSAVQNGQRLIVVVSGVKTARDRSQEARKLLEWGFRSFERREVLAADEIVGELVVFGGAKPTLAVTAGKPVEMLTPRGASDRMRGQVVYTGPLMAPIAKGAEVGRLRVHRGDTRALDIPVFAAEDVPAGSLQRKATDAALELSTGWVRRLLSRGGTP